ncbi:adenosylcobinamide amidohydrolase [Streptomyces sp. GC420]|uniref:adenosylcobinamide amidohydrolase n=1 Tax=Streptomyces sp. GC420 TaxID=2697568 RepID=UPI0014150164|nr:adenosylcobinamide amidohydrolase [Streptomyces sp. GC420]NBM16152.1 adenosylcobinamide amidohydrolase [Streptomyces sp. GC420]
MPLATTTGPSGPSNPSRPSASDASGPSNPSGLSGLSALDDLPLLTRTEHDGTWPLLLWVPDEARRMASSALLGGGIGERKWVLNAQVTPGYRRMDPAAHLAELATGLGAAGPGVGLMTAAFVADRRAAADGGVRALVTAGIGVRGWAAEPAPGLAGPPHAGTINIIVDVPVALSDAALVNAVATATEAKVQALRDAGIDASGTPTDAVCVAAARPCPGTPPEPFAGPRSVWGARIARAVHRATYEACLRAEPHARQDARQN